MAGRTEASVLVPPDVERSDAADPAQQAIRVRSHAPWHRRRSCLSRAFDVLGSDGCGKRWWRDLDRRRAGLGVSGSILVAVSVALFAIGLSMKQDSAGGTLGLPGSLNAGAMGIPMDVVTPLPAGSLTDCSVQLGNWDWYSNVSAQAEKDYMGFLFSEGSRDLVIASLRSLQPVTLGIQFWVLDSPSHPWSASFEDAVAVQVSVLNAAFASSAISFQERGTYSIPATDGDVEGCLDPNPSKGLIARLLSSIDTLSTVQVIVCDPAGVNGATSILNGERHGGAQNQTSNPLDKAIMLRRGALWQSRTSLIHQIGHFLGLPHPFPNTQTCSYDGDAIADTPMQYAGDVGCLTSLHSVPLCDSSLTIDSGQYPQFDFMDTSNDTCRQHFTPGQILRMRSMLFAFRPNMTNTNASGTGGERILPRSAFQSAMAPSAIVSRQLNLAMQHTYAGSPTSVASMSIEIVQMVGKLTSSLDQAQLLFLANGRTSLDACTCIGTNVDGEAFWTAQLGGTFYVDRVDLLLAWEAWYNTTLTTGYSPFVEVRVGHSARFWDNQICGGAPVTMDKLFKTVSCSTSSISGSFVTIRWLPQASRVTQSHGQAPMCLCDVRIMSQSIPSWSIGIANVSAVPGMPLDVNTSIASQSSTVQGGGAEQALMPLSPLRLATPSFVPCSETKSELQPWWQVELSRPNALIRGLRLAVPLRCSGLKQSSSSSSSSSPSYVFDTSHLNCSNQGSGALDGMDIFVTNVTFAASGSRLEAELASLSADSVCAKGVQVVPGTMVDVDCGRDLIGRVVTIVKSHQVGNATSSPLTSLQLCGVMPLGGWSLLGADLFNGINQAVSPSSLQPEAFVVVDGDLSTCITPTAPALGSWFAQLADPYDIVAISIRADGRRVEGSTMSVQVDLLDLSGSVAWSTKSQSWNTHMSSHAVTIIAPPVPTSAINVSGFSRFCELQVFAGSQHGLLQNIAQSMLLPHPSWSVFVLQKSQEGLQLAKERSRAVVDGNPKTCARLATFPPLVSTTLANQSSLSGQSTSTANAVIALGMEYVVPAIEILADAGAKNVTVAVWKTAKEYPLTSGNSVSLPKDRSLSYCGDPVDLNPGERKTILCVPALTGDAILITVPMSTALPINDTPTFGLCEINLPRSSYIIS